MHGVKKVTILGGTGFVGRHLTAELNNLGLTVTSVGRAAFSSAEQLLATIDGADVLIVLVGENIGQRWSESYKKALYESRITTNQQIQAALQNCAHPPSKILSASAIGIYPENDCQHPLDESCKEVGKNFLGDLGQAWELSSKQLQPQPVIMRFGVVLGKDGGALQKMLPPFKMGLGGPVAGGQQCFTWIHIADLVKGIVYLMENASAGEVYNLCSPHPLSNAEFGRTLAKVLHRPFLIPLPKWQLKLMFGEGAQVLTHSSAILPTKLQAQGFEFNYPQVSVALENILKNA